MLHRSADETRPTLLGRVRDWRDDPAWAEFVRLYEPYLRRWCRLPGLGADEAEEAVQRTWIALAGRLRSFRYDPGRSFRGWLRRFCRSRVVDMLRRDDPRRAVALGGGPAARAIVEAGRDEDDDGADRPRLLAMAAEAQRAVRVQVDPDTWRAFWLVEIEERSVREAAGLVGMSYAATFAAHKRVKQRLRAEGLRLASPAPA